jgi:hypothetical protein
MCQYWHESGDDQIEEQGVEAGWRNVMRGFDEHVARVRQRQATTRTQGMNEVRHHMVVGAGDQS